MARIVLFDRFDKDLSKWNVVTAGTDTIQIVKDTVTVNNITYNRDYVKIDHNDTTSGVAYIYKRFENDKPLDRGAIAVVVRTTSLPPAGSTLTLLGLGTWNSVDNRPTAKILFKIDENGYPLLTYLDTTGTAITVQLSSTAINDGIEHIVYVEFDKANNYLRLVLDGLYGYSTTNADVDFYIVFFGAVTTVSFTFTINIETFVMANDYLRNSVITINGKAVNINRRAYSKSLKVFAVGYYDTNGNTYVDIYDTSLNKITTINLGETVDVNDYGHIVVEPYFVRRNNKTTLYVIIGRHNDYASIIEIDPSTWSIVSKINTPSVCTYPQLAIMNDNIVVIYRKNSSAPSPLSMYNIDTGTETDIVSAGSTIRIYPILRAVQNIDPETLVVTWSYYDNTTYKRYNIYMLLYHNGKWYYPDGSEANIPVSYDDEKALVERLPYNGVYVVGNKIYLNGFYPSRVQHKVYEIVKNRLVLVSEAIPDYASEHTHYIARNNVFAVMLEYDYARSPYIISINGNEYVHYRKPEFIVLDGKVLLEIDDVDTKKLYMYEYVGDDLPDNEYSVLTITGDDTVTGITVTGIIGEVLEYVLKIDGSGKYVLEVEKDNTTRKYEIDIAGTTTIKIPIEAMTTTAKIKITDKHTQNILYEKTIQIIGKEKEKTRIIEFI